MSVTVRRPGKVQPCRYCGNVPNLKKIYWSPKLFNWQVACENSECKVKPFFNAYSWDDMGMAIAKWNDAFGQ